MVAECSLDNSEDEVTVCAEQSEAASMGTACSVASPQVQAVDVPACGDENAPQAAESLAQFAPQAQHAYTAADVPASVEQDAPSAAKARAQLAPEAEHASPAAEAPVFEEQNDVEDCANEKIDEATLEELESCEHLSELPVDFRDENHEIRKVRFAKKPFGLRFDSRMPIRISMMTKGCHAEELGVKRMWEMVAVNEIQLQGRRFQTALQLIQAGSANLPGMPGKKAVKPLCARNTGMFHVPEGGFDEDTEI